MTNEDDKECGRKEVEKPKRANRLVNPQTLKAMLAAGPWIAKVLRLAIELAKLFKT